MLLMILRELEICYLVFLAISQSIHDIQDLVEVIAFIHWEILCQQEQLLKGEKHWYLASVIVVESIIGGVLTKLQKCRVVGHVCLKINFR